MPIPYFREQDSIGSIGRVCFEPFKIRERESTKRKDLSFMDTLIHVLLLRSSKVILIVSEKKIQDVFTFVMPIVLAAKKKTTDIVMTANLQTVQVLLFMGRSNRLS